MTDHDDDERRQVVVGFDSDWQSRQWLLDSAAQEAERRKVALTVVTVRRSRDPDLPFSMNSRDSRTKSATDERSSSDGVEALRLMYPQLNIRGLRLDEGELGRESLLLRGTELLVLGSRGRFDQPAFASGSISQILIEALACPVLLIPSTTEPRGKHSLQDDERFVLVGIGEDSADLVVARAGLDEAARQGCDLHMLFSHPAMPGQLDQPDLSRPWSLVRAAATGFDASTPQLSLILTSEKPADALAHHAVNATVVVIGSRPGSLLGLVPDSVSHAVLESVHCPVLVVPRDVAHSTSVDADLAIPNLI